MGNTPPKLKNNCSDDQLSTLSQEDVESLKKTFSTMNRGKGVCSQQDFQAFFTERLDGHLLLLMRNYFFKNGSKETLNFQQFEKLFCIIARGDLYERVEAMKQLIAAGKLDSQLSVADIKQYVKSLVATYIKIQNKMQNKEFKSWKAAGCLQSAEVITVFAESLCEILTDVNINEQLTSWYSSVPHLERIQKNVFHCVYNVQQNVLNREGELITESSLPLCTEMEIPGFHSLLDMTHILFLNQSLPQHLRHEWRFLFSTTIHGESFSKLLGLITDKGPTIIVIKDKNGCMFGGFATDSWSLGPNFHGTDSSFLFTLHPYMKNFESTGYNNHYQYLNINQQTMPNGLGMGGQFEYFGMWLDADFGIGHSSESCTTYKKYCMLSEQKEFKISDVEVWGVGPKPVKEDEDAQNEPSILNKDLEARAMLEIAGKSMKSDGYRDKD